MSFSVHSRQSASFEIVSELSGVFRWRSKTQVYFYIFAICLCHIIIYKVVFHNCTVTLKTISKCQCSHSSFAVSFPFSSLSVMAIIAPYKHRKKHFSVDISVFLWIKKLWKLWITLILEVLLQCLQRLRHP